MTAPKTNPIFRRFLLWFFVLNWIVFLLSSGLLGGNAFEGGVTGEVYYVSYKGTDTVVSPLIWWMNYVQIIITFVTHIIVFLYLAKLYPYVRPQGRP